MSNSRQSRAPVVPAAYVRTLAATVERAGFDVDAFLAPEGLTANEISQAEQLPADLFGRLYQSGMRLLDDESLGTLSAGPVRAGTFRLMCLSMIGCPTLGALIQRAGEFLDIVDAVGVKPVVDVAGDEIRLGFGSPVRCDPDALQTLLTSADPVQIRTSLYYWHNLLSWFVGRALDLQRVDFAFSERVSETYSGATRGADWRLLYGAPVVFDAESSALVLPRRVLLLPNVQNEHTLVSFLRETPYRLVVPSFVPPALQDRLRALFGQMPGDALPTSEQIASRLGMSVSTLRRKLAAEGVSWQDIKEEGRKLAALRYVADTDVPITEVARLLGFDEASTFFRAFRRWTGTTPSRYRAAEALTGSRKSR
jgi:AraC-like DNA-binding protein